MLAVSSILVKGCREVICSDQHCAFQLPIAGLQPVSHGCPFLSYLSCYGSENVTTLGFCIYHAVVLRHTPSRLRSQGGLVH